MNIGFVGLGAMGALIVPADGGRTQGHRWNRSRDKAEPLIAAGMAFAATPRAVAEASDIVFSIVTDSAASEPWRSARTGSCPACARAVSTST